MPLNTSTASRASSCCFMFKVGCLFNVRSVSSFGIGFDIVGRDWDGIGGALGLIEAVLWVGIGGARPLVGVLGGGTGGRFREGVFIGVSFCLLLSTRSQIEPKSLGKFIKCYPACRIPAYDSWANSIVMPCSTHCSGIRRTSGKRAG